MSTATLLVGDVFERLAELPDGSVHCVITSPPYWRKRRYLPVDHPDAHKEIGQEPSPGEYLASLLRVTDELHRVLRDDGTMFINLGDTAAGSGGWGSDVDRHNRGGGQRWVGTNGTATAGADMPRPKSVCWIPEMFGASLAYGRHLLTDEPCRQWITRPPVTWCKPGPTPGEILDKFREATELIVFAVKQPRYWFDLDAVRLPPVPANERGTRNQQGPKQRKAAPDESHPIRYHVRTTNPNGSPPLTWWIVPTSGYDGAHYATFPPELITRPVLAGCPAQVCSVCGNGRERITLRAHVDADTGAPVELAPGDLYASDVPRQVRGTQARNGGHPRVVAAPQTVGWSDCGCPNRRWVPGTILDPFGGSGTTAMVATGHGRNCILIDLDPDNADLARERVGMFLDVDQPTKEAHRG